MKPVDVSTFIDFGIENNGKYPIPDVGNVRKSKFKKKFGQGYTSNWSEEVFVVKNV